MNNCGRVIKSIKGGESQDEGEEEMGGRGAAGREDEKNDMAK